MAEDAVPTSSNCKEARRPGRPRQEDVDSLETRLLEVALQEFIAHGYGGASLNRIVAAAAISKTTLYSRFDSKEALFHAIIAQQIDQSNATLALDETLGLEGGLTAYANYALELSLKPDVLAINRLIYSEAHRFPELGAAAAARSRLGVKQIAAFIHSRIDKKKANIEDPEAAAEVFIFMLRGWYINLTLTKQTIPASQRRRWVARAVRALVSDWRRP